MKLAILGGGGFRVPLVYGALLRDTSARRVDEVVLYDTDAAVASRRSATCWPRWAPGASSRRGSARPRTWTPHSRAPTSSSPRSASAASRAAPPTSGSPSTRAARPGDHRAGRLSRTGCARCPSPSTSPSGSPSSPRARGSSTSPTRPGMVTEAMQQVLGDRVVGICDSPIGLGRRAARALGLDPERTTADYAGLNHLGWLRGPAPRRRDVLPRPARRRRAARSIEEGRLFGADWIRSLGAVPNEYLHYYYFTRDAVAAIRGSGADPRRVPARPAAGLLRRRGRRPGHGPGPVGPGTRASARRRTWRRPGRPRASERDERDVEGGGYEGVALAIMARHRPRRAGDADPQRPQRHDAARAAARGRGRGAVHRSTPTARTPSPTRPLDRRAARAGAAGQGGRAAVDRGGRGRGRCGVAVRRSRCTPWSTRSARRGPGARLPGPHPGGGRAPAVTPGGGRVRSGSRVTIRYRGAREGGARRCDALGWAPWPDPMPPPSSRTRSTAQAALLRGRGWRNRTISHTGYGSPEFVRVLGRVLLSRHRDEPVASDAQASLRELYGAEEVQRGWRAFVTAPAMGVPVTVTVGGAAGAHPQRPQRLHRRDRAHATASSPGWHDVTLSAEGAEHGARRACTSSAPT